MKIWDSCTNQLFGDVYLIKWFAWNLYFSVRYLCPIDKWTNYKTKREIQLRIITGLFFFKWLKTMELWEFFVVLHSSHLRVCVCVCFCMPNPLLWWIFYSLIFHLLLIDSFDIPSHFVTMPTPLVVADIMGRINYAYSFLTVPSCIFLCPSMEEW